MYIESKRKSLSDFGKDLRKNNILKFRCPFLNLRSSHLPIKSE